MLPERSVRRDFISSRRGNGIFVLFVQERAHGLFRNGAVCLFKGQFAGFRILCDTVSSVCAFVQEEFHKRDAVKGMVRLLEAFKARVANERIKLFTQILDTDMLCCGFGGRVERGNSGFDSGLLCRKYFIERGALIGVVGLCVLDCVSDSKVLFHGGVLL